MITQNEVFTGNFQNNILVNGLNKPDRSQLVFDLSGGYNVIDYIVGMARPSRPTHGNDGYFEVPIMGNPVTVAQILSTSANGANLIVNFVDTSYSAFRVQEVVGDGTAAMNQGRVVATGAGWIEIEPIETGGSWTSKFAAGAYAVALYTASPLRGSDPLTSLYAQPKYVGNQTAVMRENLELYSADLLQTWTTANMEIDAQTGIWASAQDKIMAQRIARATELRALWSPYGTYNSASGGKVNYSQGLKDAIKDPDRNGTYRGWTNFPNEAQFIQWIGEAADKQSKPKTTYKLIVGRGLLNIIQSFNSPMIVNTGVLNTVGGQKVTGMDSYLYSIDGFMIDVIHHPLFNNADLFPALTTLTGGNAPRRMQYTGLFVDEGTYNAVGKPGVSLPAMEKVYYPVRGQEEIYYYTPGIIGSELQGAGLTGLEQTSGQVNLAVTQKDAFTFGYYSNFCFNFMTQRMGWCEVVL